MIKRQENTDERFWKRFNFPKMRLFLPLFAIFALLAAVPFFWWRQANLPAQPQDSASYRFVVSRGQSAQQVANSLEKEGLIKSSLAFKLYTQATGKQGKIQAGQYDLSPSLPLTKIVENLLGGPKELWVTYPEGVRREEMAVRTITTLGLEGETASSFWLEFMQESEGLEGLLFPDTYLFPREVSAKIVVSSLRRTFEEKTGGEYTTADIILASIVERETRTVGERPIVAGILGKRLAASWPLQADATLQYITGNARCGEMAPPQVLDCPWWKVPTAQDKTLRSAYNTYAQTGLPPAPIANPGLSSIKAVQNPEDSPYWFYLHAPDGQIYYAKTSEEHIENINNYLR